MRKKLTLFMLLFGMIMVIASLVIRHSYEREMYKLYIEKQQQSLLSELQKSWKDYLLKKLKENPSFPGKSLKVTTDGKFIGDGFFPTQAKEKVNWNSYNKLSDNEKQNFLVEIFKKKPTWDRAIAIGLWKKSFGPLPLKKLSQYETTLSSSKSSEAYKLLLKQKERISDLLPATKDYSLDLVVYTKNTLGSITIFTPDREAVTKNILNLFVKDRNLIGITIEENPFTLKASKESVTANIRPTTQIITILLGFIFIITSVILYLIDLREKKKLILKQVSFLNQLVHEIKTPITGIKLSSDLLKRDGYDEELIDGLLTSTTRINELFEDIILINNDTRLVNQDSLSPQQLHEFIDEIVIEFKGRIKVEISEVISITLDKRRLRIILRNLLKNAIRYGRRGHLEIGQSKEELIFTVTDQGKGISKANAAYIFNEFYRSQSAINQSPDGIGIGLSIAQKLTKEMKGTLELLNPGQEKAKFQLRIRGIRE